MQLHTSSIDYVALAKRLEAARRSAPGEPVRFDGSEAAAVATALERCVEFVPEVPAYDQRILIDDALTRAAVMGTVTPEALVQALAEVEQHYLKQPVQEYVLATTVTLPFVSDLPRMKLRDARILFSAQLPRPFARAREQLHLPAGYVRATPEHWATVRVSVNARTPSSACNEALLALDALRGIWNYCLNWNLPVERPTASYRPVPINNMLLGPIHTLHTPDGARANDLFWYQPQYLQSDVAFPLESVWASLSQREKVVRQRLKTIPYRNQVLDLFALYARALDHADPDAAFSKLWHVCEQLTGTTSTQPAFVQRCLFVEADEQRLTSAQILERLCAVRAGAYQEDRARHSLRMYLFQLLHVVGQLFQFHLTQGALYANMELACEILDLPADAKALADAVKRYQQALQYQRGKHSS